MEISVNIFDLVALLMAAKAPDRPLDDQTNERIQRLFKQVNESLDQRLQLPVKDKSPVSVAGESK